MSAGKKINWLLILQGWTMLWVVLGHSPLGEAGEGPVWENVIYNAAYSFHMSLFMLISGYLFRLTRLSTAEGRPSMSYVAMLRDKALRLLLPMAVFTLAAFAVKLAFPGEMSRGVSLSFKEILNAFIYPYNGPLREMWFIYTLFWFFCLAPVWRASLRRGWMTVTTAAVLLLCHYFHPDVEFLSLKRVFDYGFWFYAGVVLADRDVIERYLSKVRYPLLAVGAALYWLGTYTDRMVTTLGAIVFSIALALVLDRLLPKLFSSFRNYTYQIFLMGIFAQMAVKILFRHFDIPYLAGYLLCAAVGLYVPVLISVILRKINCRPLLLCIGLKSSVEGGRR